MGISSLNTVITTDFITQLSKQGSSSSKPSIGLSSTPQEPLSVTLQRGARGAAASIQSLNAGISYINVAKDYTEKMLEVVDGLESLVNKAGQGDISPSKAKLYKLQFDRFSDAYEKLVKGSVIKGHDLLSVTDMSAVLKQGGLNPDKVSELETAFKKISSFSGVDVTNTGTVEANGELVAPETFYRALRQATRDPEDPLQDDDGSGAFASIKVTVKSIKEKVTKNIEALTSASELVEKNLKLVRATGFAFLNASQQDDQGLDVESIAARVRGEIRSGARDVLSEAHNLQSILAAGLLVVAEQSKK
jgi:hypothetical protein